MYNSNISNLNNETIDQRKKYKKNKKLINFIVTIFNRVYKFHKMRIDSTKQLLRN